MSETEWGVLVIDAAPGSGGMRVELAGNRRQAERRVRHWAEVNKTRGTYGVVGRVVYRFIFMSGMPWMDLTGREVHP